MQSLAATMPFRRFYFNGKVRMPKEALAARTASAPLAVRLRRSKKFGAVAPGETDANSDGLTPSEHSRFLRLRAKGKIHKDMHPGSFAAEANIRRSRIRGFKNVKLPSGEQVRQVVGRTVYLPNIIFRLVRNHTPAGQPYNPYEATFRIPNSITKTDVRSYLWSVYGVRTTYIRTDNYFSPLFPRLGNGRKTYKTYKRAVVGLRDPFYYPLRMEDMEAGQRKDREKWIEDNFAIQHTRNLQKYELLRLTKGQAKGWKFNAPFATKRSHILRLVAERREKREGLITGYASEFREMREKGERITLDNIKKPGAVPLEEHSSVPAVVQS